LPFDVVELAVGDRIAAFFKVSPFHAATILLLVVSIDEGDLPNVWIAVFEI